jgi:hypothetical protein
MILVFGQGLDTAGTVVVFRPLLGGRRARPLPPAGFPLGARRSCRCQGGLGQGRAGVHDSPTRRRAQLGAGDVEGLTRMGSHTHGHTRPSSRQRDRVGSTKRGRSSATERCRNAPDNMHILFSFLASTSLPVCPNSASYRHLATATPPPTIRWAGKSNRSDHERLDSIGYPIGCHTRPLNQPAVPLQQPCAAVGRVWRWLRFHSFSLVACNTVLSEFISSRRPLSFVSPSDLRWSCVSGILSSSSMSPTVCSPASIRFGVY